MSVYISTHVYQLHFTNTHSHTTVQLFAASVISSHVSLPLSFPLFSPIPFLSSLITRLSFPSLFPRPSLSRSLSLSFSLSENVEYHLNLIGLWNKKDDGFAGPSPYVKNHDHMVGSYSVSQDTYTET